MLYEVSRRTNRIDIRMAPGVSTSCASFSALLLVTVGMAIGLAVALAAGRLVATTLFGLSPTDISTIALAMVTMVTMAMLACYLPVRQSAT